MNKNTREIHLNSLLNEEDSNRSGSLYDANLEDDEEGSGGKSQGIEVRVATGVAGLRRDDLLPPSELNHLLLIHNDIHKAHVEKQKITREQRAALKEGRYIAPTASQQRAGLGGGSGGSSHYKKHPISDKAQFSGIDKQVVAVPTLNEAETNAELKDALENRYENKYRNTPKFNPKPRPS